MDWVEIAAQLKFVDNVSWTNLPQALYEKTGLNYSHSKIRAALRRHPDYKRVIYEDKKEYTEEDIENFINQMMALQQAQEKLNTKQVKATVRIPDDKPIGIAHWGDWHIGAVGTDYKQLNADKEKIINTEGLYFIGMGDYKDNYISGTHIGGNFEQIIQPGMQDMVTKHQISQVGEKCVALVRGCHDSWDKKQGDRDFLETLCGPDVANCVNLWHGGELTIKLGDETYAWRVRHKYKYQSSLNYENAMRRIMEIQGPCDVAAEAHLHNAFVMSRHIMGKFRILLRSGGYKIWDEHGQQIAGCKGKIGVPVVVIYPDKHELVEFRELDQAITYLTAARKEYT